MTASRASGVALVLLALVLSVVAPLPAAGQTQDDVDQARQERDRAANSLDEAEDEEELADDELLAAVTRYEDINAELQAVVYQNNVLRERVTAYEADLRVLRDEVQGLAVEAYMAGEDEQLIIFEVETFNQLATSQEVLEKATNRNQTRLDRLEATRRDLDRLKAQYVDDQARIDELRNEAEFIVADLAVVLDQREGQRLEAETKLARATVELGEAEARFEAEQLRKRLAAIARQQGAAAGIGEIPGIACPVAASHGFINSWGFPRSGGRSHKGTDIFAQRSAPLVAVDNGSVQLGSNRLGGITVWLTADHGVAYYYAHLEAYGPNLRSGDRVSKGQVIGYNGNSGNAYTAHLHIQMHPGGRRSPAVNPYSTMVYACG